jgi:hypothetical protein
VQIWGQIIADGRAWFDDVRWEEANGGFGLWWLFVGGIVLLLALTGGYALFRGRRS